MIKPIAIVAGEPNSISSEIIFKSWRLRKKYKHKPFFIIGNIKILELQKKKLKFKIKFKEINKNFKINDIKDNFLPVYNIKYNQNKAFQKISVKSNKYIFDCFGAAINFIKDKKISGLINCPIKKETLFKKKHQGITEYLAKCFKSKDKEVMLIFNKRISVSPITTHVPISNVSKQIEKNKIVKKVITINKFYLQKFNIIPIIHILGLNPHNFSPNKHSEEKLSIVPAIKQLKKNKIKVYGPISPDTSFLFNKKNKPNVIVGMYHDQVLLPFKTIFKYDAINITLGLPFIRVSPDHGVGENITGKNVANPKSLIESIKFFSLIK
tara:strand:- start:60 stop:1031 length:972 start_codon:yes stop_codon:yes gene_type:complete